MSTITALLSKKKETTLYFCGRSSKADLVIDRAKEIVEELVNEDITIRVSEIAVGGKDSGAKKKAKPKKYDEMDLAQFSLFDTVKDDDVLEELKNIDVGNLTPVDALNTIYRLQNKLKNRW